MRYEIWKKKWCEILYVLLRFIFHKISKILTLSDLAQHYLMKAGISVIRRIKKTDNNRIARYFSYFVDKFNFLGEVGSVANAWMQT